jgi:hypothetical protein
MFRKAAENVGEAAANSDELEQHFDGRGLVMNLRSAQVTNVYGQLVSLGDVMGSGTSVVVFLRHLG